MHEAFYFGPVSRQIFASYHAPASGAGSVLTVLCPPLFSEYMRTHGALRQVAMTLSGRGQHVLRFDFRGTGDSSGDLERLAVADWIEDITSAIEEGREITGCDEVRVLGVRASALLACKALGRVPGISRIVLWDPVRDGGQYLKSLCLMQEELVRQNPYLGRGQFREAMREYGGYALGETMVHELGALGSEVYGASGALLEAVSTTSERDILVPGMQYHVSPFACEWGTVSTELIVPRPVIERLVECLTRP